MPATGSLVLPGLALAVLLAFALAVPWSRARIIRALLRDLRSENAEPRRTRLVLVRVLGRDLGFALAAAAFVEVAFGIPGIGRGVAVAVRSSEPYVAQTLLVWAGLIGIGVHFAIDVIVGALDDDVRANWPFATIPSPP